MESLVAVVVPLVVLWTTVINKMVITRKVITVERHKNATLLKWATLMVLMYVNAVNGTTGQLHRAVSIVMDLATEMVALIPANLQCDQRQMDIRAAIMVEGVHRHHHHHHMAHIHHLKCIMDHHYHPVIKQAYLRHHLDLRRPFKRTLLLITMPTIIRPLLRQRLKTGAVGKQLLPLLMVIGKNNHTKTFNLK
jgi:hypothetical protein